MIRTHIDVGDVKKKVSAMSMGDMSPSAMESDMMGEGGTSGGFDKFRKMREEAAAAQVCVRVFCMID